MRHKLLITIPTVVTLIITSCSKHKPESPDTSSNKVSATISIGSNAAFQFSVTGAAVHIYTEITSPSIYHIEAKDADNNDLSFVVENVTQTGTYLFTSNNGIGNGLSFIKNYGAISEVIYWTSDASITNKGSVTITALDNHHIEGVFTAFCQQQDHGEPAQVSNGSFKGNF